MVKTTLQFRMFRDSLARMIHETYGNAVTVSLYGAQIPNCPYRSFDDILSEIPTVPLDKRFLHRHLSPDLSRRRSALERELHSFDNQLLEFENKLLDVLQPLQQLAVADNRFSAEIENAVEQFFALQERHSLCFTLCTPLSPSSTILLSGAPEQFNSTAQLTHEERTSLKNKLVNALSDFYRAVRDNRQAIERAIATF